MPVRVSHQPASVSWPASPRHPAGEPAGFPKAVQDALELLARAEALGIPWRRILQEEIAAESLLQGFLDADVTNLPLWQAIGLLPNTLLQSWRVRARIGRASWEASANGSLEAVHELSDLHDHFRGRPRRGATSRSALDRHLCQAYERIRELQAAARAAERARGEDPARFVCETAGCSLADAEWAVARASSAERTFALDDAVRHARDEGFEIPQGDTELDSFVRLKRLISRRARRRRPSSRRSPSG